MTEKVSGCECDVYRIKSGASGEVRVWMARKLDYPIKSTGVDRRGAGLQPDQQHQGRQGD